MTIVAITDVHGCRQELERLINTIDNMGLKDPTFIFHGDYTDRGPDSKGVIDFLLEFEKNRSCVYLRGNHDKMVLDALRGQDFYTWYSNGGNKTEESYFPEGISNPHVSFLSRTRLFFETEKYLHVHAGVNPYKELDENTEDDFIWIRRTFTMYDRPFNINGIEKVVVHGHTVEGLDKPTVKNNRINIDTGCVFGGHLTSLIIHEDDTREFVQVKAAKTYW